MQFQLKHTSKEMGGAHITPQVLLVILDGQMSVQGSFIGNANVLNKFVNQVTERSTTGETMPSFLKSKKIRQHELVSGFLGQALREGWHTGCVAFHLPIHSIIFRADLDRKACQTPKAQRIQEEN